MSCPQSLETFNNITGFYTRINTDTHKHNDLDIQTYVCINTQTMKYLKLNSTQIHIRKTYSNLWDMLSNGPNLLVCAVFLLFPGEVYSRVALTSQVDLASTVTVVFNRTKMFNDL